LVSAMVVWFNLRGLLHYNRSSQTQPNPCSNLYSKPGMLSIGKHTFQPLPHTSGTTLPQDSPVRRGTARQSHAGTTRQSDVGTTIHSQCVGLSAQISTALFGLSSRRRAAANPTDTHLRGIDEARVGYRHLVVPCGRPTPSCRPSRWPATIVAARKSRCGLADVRTHLYLYI
jgi:hypothetical protein